MKVFAVLLCLYIIQNTLILLLEFRRPQRTVAWMFILLCVPPLGFLFYYTIGRNYVRARQVAKGSNNSLREIRQHVERSSFLVKSSEDSGNPEFENHKEFLHLLANLTNNPITGRNESRILPSGEEAFRAILEAMEKAEQHIHVQFYIFRDDQIGNRFKEVMVRKARQGVKVRLLCDGIGSHKLSGKFIHSLKKEGVEFHYFLPPLMSILDRRLNYRNHRKVVIVDGVIGFTGGLNVGDDYLGLYPKVGYWRDTHVQLKGDSVYFLQVVFLKDWSLVSGERLSHPRLFSVHSCQGREAVQIVDSGPERGIDATEEIYFSSICAAKYRIWISSPYFIPNSPINRALKSAVLRGIDVRIIIPGQPDSWLVHYASLSYVEDLQDAGVKFYRYQKGFMHAKVVVIDELVASVGSANLDLRSLYSNFELTAVLLDPNEIKTLAQQFEEDLSFSEYVDPKEFKQRGRMKKLKENVCHLFSPLL